MGMGVIGIGYEGVDVETLVSRLLADQISLVADVRLTPISRKAGLSKVRLAERLSAAGIGYEHLRALGNPRDNRSGFADRHGLEGAAARARFSEILSTTPAADALDRLLELSARRRVAVLCFEAEQHLCHRELVLEALNTRARTTLRTVARHLPAHGEVDTHQALRSSSA